MPRLQYVTVRERDLGGGIDQQSAENQLAEGYCEDIENADPKSTGQVAKRTGYQGYAGYVPVRVQAVEYSGTTINFILADSIELPTGQSSPLIVQGQTSEASGDFASETIIYFENFTADIRRVFGTGSGSVSLPQTEHDISTPLMFIGVAASTSVTNNSNEQFFPDAITIDKTTYDVDIDYTNNTSDSFDAFIYAKDKSAVAGTTYVQTGNTVNTGSNSFTITAGTHALDNNNIIVEVYEDTGTEYKRVQADEVYLNDSTGDIQIDIQNNTSSSFTAVFILTAAPTANFTTGSVAAGTTRSITIDASGTGGSNFAFVSCYLEPTIGGILEQVIPDSIVADATNQTITISFTNNNSSGANFEIYWDFAQVVTNKLSVTGTASASFTDSSPQLTIWGLCHEEIYGTREAREGWVNHIDSYRAPGESRLICGLGGNLYAARLRAEVGNDATYLMPLHYPYINARVASDTIIGPAFYDTGETPGRTRGFITGDDGGSNFFTISSVNYNSGTGYTDYVLTVPNMVISGTLSTIISTTAGLEDRFTTQQCGYSIHNGTFVIKAVSSGVDTLTISVENTSIDSDDYDETDVGGLGGVFTDRMSMTATSPFLAGDDINSDIFDDSTEFSCLNSSGVITLIDGVVEVVSIPGGLRVVASRTSDIVPIRDVNNSATVTNLVRGDMVQITNFDRQFRIKSINQLSDISISITGDGTDATVTLGSGDTTTLFIGKKLLISGTSNYNGAQEVTEIIDATNFKFSSSNTTTEAGTIIGKTIQIDETITYSDTTDSSVSVNVHARWIPVESPTDSYNLTPSTRVSYFDSLGYDAQNIVRSTMVQDNLYLTNDADEVLKFDGTNLYRAGLFRWQPNLFVTTDTSPSGKINMDNPSVSFTAISNNQFTVAAGDEKTFAEGDKIQTSTDNEIYTIISTDTSGKIIVDGTISGAASGTVTKIKTFLYYFRLNAVDANENVIASAIAGSEDFAVQLGADTAVNIKLVGMPAWDIYDYDKLEVQIYRTKGDEVAPYYRLTTLAMSFNNDDGYISYTDTDSDEDLRDLDEVNTALKGAELGTAWEQPLRAKYCTTAGNRLILGNLKDYPTLDIRVLKNSGILTQSVFTNASNKLWRLRKDNTDTATTTNMLNRASYEFTSANTVNVSGITGTVGTSFSVNAVGHGFTTAGEWVYLFHDAITDGNDLSYSGWWQITSVTNVDNFVINAAEAGSGAASNFPNKLAYATARTDIPVYIGTDGNYAMANGNRATTVPYEFLAMRRLADAVNTSMRKVDTSISGYSNFSPWVLASAGNEFNTGQIIIKQPKVFTTTLEVEIPSLSGDFDVFINNIRRSGSAQVSALTKVYPSRIMASYQNYPEIFDNPTAIVDSESDSVIDINSADGQEITAIIPFFGDAAFGAAQKSGIIVVFKTNSVYLVDLAAKAAGQNAVQRLETRGKGCTAPYSVSVTRGGIMFANDTGIYRLGRDLRVEYIGRKYERIFKEEVERDYLELATGHHDTEANSYKLSYPISEETENSKVAVYNHTREYEGQGDGSWTTYTNHPTTGWANLDADSFFSSTNGRVFSIRKLGDTSDYRDDDVAISMVVITRAMDVLESAKRKIFGKIITHYRTVANSTGTELTAALDLKTSFQDTDTFSINKELESTGVGDEGTQKVVTVVSVVKEKVGVYIQLKYTNATIDEPVEIAGIDFRVAAKSEHGITEAAETTE